MISFLTLVFEINFNSNKLCYPIVILPTRANSVLTADSKQKKGIKSSIGRLFGKKKEGGGRLEPTVGRDGQALPALTGLTPASSSAWKTSYTQLK